MSAKRALVVDDSKSARAFLARILERHEITVDAADSAEAAIDYLTRNRPDVIFMDHMMPGMDGFQAVQSIKNNPRTCAIPILMYTSQEGDLYAGQARALGAEGVLPKQIKQSDVTKMLYQLRLVTDRRASEQSTFRRLQEEQQLLPANEAEIADTPAEQAEVEVPADAPTPPVVDIAKLLPQMSLEIRAALDGSLQKEVAELRNFISVTLDAQADRLQHALVGALTPPPRAPEIDAPTMVPERSSWAAIIGWTVALLALAAVAALSRAWWQQGGELAALRTDLDAAYAEVEALRARPAVVSQQTPDAGVPADTVPAPAADALDDSAPSTAVAGPAVAVPAFPAAPAAEARVPQEAGSDAPKATPADPPGSPAQ
jgi:CheY-like chemotaxis protein